MSDATKRAIAIAIVSFGFLFFGSWLLLPSIGWHGVVGIWIMLWGNNSAIEYRRTEARIAELHALDKAIREATQ